MASLAGYESRFSPKIWTKDEIKTIIDYMLLERDVEKPTPEIYYQKLVDCTGINATWRMVRHEVLLLRYTYRRADYWRKTTGTRWLKQRAKGYVVKGKMLEICPQFYDLREIFGKKFYEGGTENIGAATSIENNNVLPESPISRPPIIGNHPKYAENVLDKTEDLENYELDFSYDKEHLKLEEAKLQAAIDMSKREYELKLLEIEKDERIQTLKINSKMDFKIMQLEKDERMQHVAMGLKYMKPECKPEPN